MDYHSRVRSTLVTSFAFGLGLLGGAQLSSQDAPAGKPDAIQGEPHYDDTFSGPIIELSDDKITVSRSILGKPAEKRTFLIKPDTRVEGKLRAKVKVTVGFITENDVDVARLIVVRPQKK
jgi:hypothetical protein